jgi:hypothetical protein
MIGKHDHRLARKRSLVPHAAKHGAQEINAGGKKARPPVAQRDREAS